MSEKCVAPILAAFLPHASEVSEGDGIRTVMQQARALVALMRARRTCAKAAATRQEQCGVHGAGEQQQRVKVTAVFMNCLHVNAQIGMP